MGEGPPPRNGPRSPTRPSQRRGRGALPERPSFRPPRSRGRPRRPGPAESGVRQPRCARCGVATRERCRRRRTGSAARSPATATSGAGPSGRQPYGTAPRGSTGCRWRRGGGPQGDGGHVVAVRPLGHVAKAAANDARTVLAHDDGTSGTGADGAAERDDQGYRGQNSAESIKTYAEAYVQRWRTSSHPLRRTSRWPTSNHPRRVSVADVIRHRHPVPIRPKLRRRVDVNTS